jgi:hypothetical protein
LLFYSPLDFWVQHLHYFVSMLSMTLLWLLHVLLIYVPSINQASFLVNLQVGLHEFSRCKYIFSLIEIEASSEGKWQLIWAYMYYIPPHLLVSICWWIPPWKMLWVCVHAFDVVCLFVCLGGGWVSKQLDDSPSIIGSTKQFIMSLSFWASFFFVFHDYAYFPYSPAAFANHPKPSLIFMLFFG